VAVPMTSSGSHPVRQLMRARVRQQLVEEGVEGVLTPKRSPNSARKRIFDGASEAKLIALACSAPPEGYARWTLQLLESKVVELNIVERASDNTIGRTLKNDPDLPVVCVDETSKQLIVETRQPVPAKPGQPRRIDYEYRRNGTANLFMMFAPLQGWRHVKVTDRHAAIDYAQALKELSDTHFPKASKIVLVQDNLSTHKPASLYQAFPAAEARRLVDTTRLKG
jgi:hypothetical protein